MAVPDERIHVVWVSEETTGVPSGDDWLQGPELTRQAELGTVARRDEWRLGRWLAKRTVASLVTGTATTDPDDIERVGIAVDALGAPVVTVEGAPAPVTVSISHKRGRGLCMATAAGVRLGCDLELVAPRRDGFADRWLLPSERDLAAGSPDPDMAATLVWSVKESTLKALGTGWRRPLSTVEVRADPTTGDAEWSGLSVADAVERSFWSGWWRLVRTETREWIVTMVADPSPCPPVPLGQRGPGSENSTVS